MANLIRNSIIGLILFSACVLAFQTVYVDISNPTTGYGNNMLKDNSTQAWDELRENHMDQLRSDDIDFTYSQSYDLAVDKGNNSIITDGVGGEDDVIKRSISGGTKLFSFSDNVKAMVSGISTFLRLPDWVFIAGLTIISISFLIAFLVFLRSGGSL